jgi:hypothetical protein
MTFLKNYDEISAAVMTSPDYDTHLLHAITNFNNIITIGYM